MDWTWTRNKLGNISRLAIYGQRKCEDMNRAELEAALRDAERQIAEIRAQPGYLELRKERVR